jgi:hypothetical protein
MEANLMYSTNHMTGRRSAFLRIPDCEGPASEFVKKNPFTGTDDYWCYMAGERIPYDKKTNMPKLSPYEYS